MPESNYVDFLDRKTTSLSPMDVFYTGDDKQRREAYERGMKAGFIPPENDGFWGETWDGLRDGGMSLLEGLAATATEMGLGSGFEEWTKEVRSRHHDIEAYPDYKPTDSFTNLGALGRTIGHGLGQSLPSVALTWGTSLAGHPEVGLLASGVLTGAQTYGESKRYMEAVLPDDMKEFAPVAAFIDSALEAAIEVNYGPEKLASMVGVGKSVGKETGRNVLKNISRQEVKRVLADLASDPAGRSILMTISKSIAKGAAEEGLEEGMQALTRYVTAKVFGSDAAEFNFGEVFQEMVAGAVSGGIQSGIVGSFDKKDDSVYLDTGKTDEKGNKIYQKMAPRAMAQMAYDTGNLTAEEAKEAGYIVGDFVEESKAVGQEFMMEGATDEKAFSEEDRKKDIKKSDELLRYFDRMFNGEVTIVGGDIAKQVLDKAGKPGEISGARAGNVIYIRQDGRDVERILGHELKHYLDKFHSDLSHVWDDDLMSMLNDSGKEAVNAAMDKYKDELGEDGALREFKAEAFGNVLKSNKWRKAFIDKLERKEEGLGRKFLQSAKEFVDKLLEYAGVHTQAMENAGKGRRADASDIVTDLQGISDSLGRTLAELAKRSKTRSDARSAFGGDAFPERERKKKEAEHKEQMRKDAREAFRTYEALKMIRQVESSIEEAKAKRRKMAKEAKAEKLEMANRISDRLDEFADLVSVLSEKFGDQFVLENESLLDDLYEAYGEKNLSKLDGLLNTMLEKAKSFAKKSLEHREFELGERKAREKAREDADVAFDKKTIERNEFDIEERQIREEKRADAESVFNTRESREQERQALRRNEHAERHAEKEARRERERQVDEDSQEYARQRAEDKAEAESLAVKSDNTESMSPAELENAKRRVGTRLREFEKLSTRFGAIRNKNFRQENQQELDRLFNAMDAKDYGTILDSMNKLAPKIVEFNRVNNPDAKARAKAEAEALARKEAQAEERRAAKAEKEAQQKRDYEERKELKRLQEQIDELTRKQEETRAKYEEDFKKLLAEEEAAKEKANAEANSVYSHLTGDKGFKFARLPGDAKTRAESENVRTEFLKGVTMDDVQAEIDGRLQKKSLAPLRDILDGMTDEERTEFYGNVIKDVANNSYIDDMRDSIEAGEVKESGLFGIHAVDMLNEIREERLESEMDTEDDGDYGIEEMTEDQIREATKNGDVNFSRVTDPRDIRKIERELEKDANSKDGVFYAYRTMELDKDGLRPPKAEYVNGQRVPPVNVGDIIQTDIPTKEQIEQMLENGQLRWETKADGRNVLKFKLKTNDVTDVWADYNPYLHARLYPYNNQLNASYKKNYVMVKVAIPRAELFGDKRFMAEGAKDSVGITRWNTQGAQWMAKAFGEDSNSLVLTRFMKIVEILDADTQADLVADNIKKAGVTLEAKTMPKALRDALVSRGVNVNIGEEVREWEAAEAKKSQRIDLGDDVQFSRRSMEHDIAEGKMLRDLVDHKVFKKNEAKEWLAMVSRVVDKVISYDNLFDLGEKYDKDDRRYSPFKKNSDPIYKVSADFSTLCKKRIVMQAVVDHLQSELKKGFLTRDENIAVRQMLKDFAKKHDALQVACHVCYVEAARLKAPEQLEKLFASDEKIRSEMTNYFANISKEFKKQTKEAQKRWMKENGYRADLTKKELKAAANKRGLSGTAEFDRLNTYLKEFRVNNYKPTRVEEEAIARFIKNGKTPFLNSQSIMDMAYTDPIAREFYVDYVRQTTKSKALEPYVPYYYGDSVKAAINPRTGKPYKGFSDALIKKMNDSGTGIRHQSWSDFQLSSVLDTITMLADLSVRKAKMHAYTKVPDMVRIFGKSGIMFNLSLIPNEKGRGFSTFDGMDIKTARELRDMFPENVGTVAIAKNFENLLEMLDDDDIDYIIPYHSSGMPIEIRKMQGIGDWQDFQNMQTWKPNNKIKETNDPNWHKEPSIYELVKKARKECKDGRDALALASHRFVDLCNKRGITPRFAKVEGLFSRNENGTWKLLNDNYWKVLVDHKMFNHLSDTHTIVDQKYVRPEFNEGAIYDAMDREAKTIPVDLARQATEYVASRYEEIPDVIKALKEGNDPEAQAIEALSEEEENSEEIEYSTPSFVPFAKTKQVNPVPEGMPHHAERQAQLDNAVHEVHSDDWVAEKAGNLIVKAGGVEGFVQDVLDGVYAIKGDVVQRAVRLVQANDDFYKLPDDTRYAFYEADTKAGTEWGQSGRQRRLDIHTPEGLQAALRSLVDRDYLERKKKGIKGKSLAEQIQEKFGVDPLKLPPDIMKDEKKRDEFLRGVSAMRHTFLDKLYEYWMNAILSSPQTHMANSIGNTANLFYELGPKRLAEATVNLFAKKPEGASFGEMKEMFKHAKWGEAWKAAKRAFSLEMEERNGDIRDAKTGVAIGGKLGRIVRLPTRLLNAADVLVKQLVQPMEASAMAFREGKAKGLSGTELTNYISNELANEHSSANKYGQDRALDLTFQEDPGAGVRWMIGAKEKIPFMRYLFPFVKTPYNILRQGIRKSPLGIFNLAWDIGKNLHEKKGIDNRIMAETAEQILAWGAVLALMGGHGGNDEPWFTGSTQGMYGSGEQQFKNSHVPPMSIRIGDKWLSYSRIEPFASALSLIADGMAGYNEAKDGAGATAGMKKAMTGTLRLMSEKSYLNTFSEIVDFLQNPDQKGQKMVSSMVSSFVPNAWRNFQNAMEENIPDYSNRFQGDEWWSKFFVDTLSRGGLHTKTPKLDYFGRPVPKGAEDSFMNSFIWRLTVPIQVKDASMDQADSMLWEYNRRNPDEPYWPTLPNPTAKINGKEYSFTHDYTELAEKSGKLAKKMVDDAIRRGELDISNPDAEDIAKVKRIFQKARSVTRDEMVRRKRYD